MNRGWFNAKQSSASSEPDKIGDGMDWFPAHPLGVDPEEALQAALTAVDELRRAQQYAAAAKVCREWLDRYPAELATTEEASRWRSLMWLLARDLELRGQKTLN